MNGKFKFLVPIGALCATVSVTSVLLVVKGRAEAYSKFLVPIGVLCAVVCTAVAQRVFGKGREEAYDEASIYAVAA